MDQHPIPQDVTGFQFKLIGTMTVKQFGYVASGVIMAVVLYYLPLPGIFWILVKVMLIPLLGGSGAFVAFVPIEGRPVDVMAGNFFKAIFSPNQYIYRKAGRKFSFSTVTFTKVAPAAANAPAKQQSTPASVKQAGVDIKAAQLQAYLRSSHNEVKNSLDQKELTMLSSLALPTAPKPTVASASPTAHAAPTPVPAPMQKPVVPAHTPAPAPAPTQKTAQEQSLAQKESALQHELQTAQQEESTTHAPAAHEKVTTLQKQLNEIHAQKMHLEQELQQLKSQLTAQKSQPTPQPIPQAAAMQHTAATVMQATPAAPPAAAPIVAAPAATTPPLAGIPASQYAKTVAQTPTKKADLPNISDTPNVVVGIVKDPRGNILPNMLVEVKDKDGNPVRAFKTNPLGQFASATPLAKGVYTIELDDPKKQHTFDVIQITANDQIMLPIEIISHDAREELRKQLFN